jgi:hypothetical protein
MTHWIKLLGTATPRTAWVPNDWLPSHHSRDGLIQFESGPKADRGVSPIEVGDEVILAGAGWGRAFAAVEILRGPELAGKPRWGPRWPWVLWGRPIAWVAHVENAPKLAEIGLPRSFGSSYRRITEDQYSRALDELFRRGAASLQTGGN